MPLYRFLNTEKDEVFETFMTMAEREEFLSSNPHIVQPPAIPGVCDPIRIGVTRTTEDFNSILKNIKKKHRGSTIKTR